MESIKERKKVNYELKDLKIRNIRPSEDLIVEFLNWKIDLSESKTQCHTVFVL